MVHNVAVSNDNDMLFVSFIVCAELLTQIK